MSLHQFFPLIPLSVSRLLSEACFVEEKGLIKKSVYILSYTKDKGYCSGSSASLQLYCFQLLISQEWVPPTP